MALINLVDPDGVTRTYDTELLAQIGKGCQHDMHPTGYSSGGVVVYACSKCDFEDEYDRS